MRARTLLMVAAGICPVSATAQEEGKPTLAGNPGQYFGMDQYPPDAMRAREQGRVAAILSVDATGKVAGCTIDVSSGSASLDAATCRIAQARMTFTPARDTNGRAVAGRYPLAVRWSLDDGSEALNETVDAATAIQGVIFDHAIRLRIDPAGKVESCVVENSADTKTFHDPCMAYTLGQKVSPSATRAGRPVRSTRIEKHSMSIQYDP